MRQWVNKKMGLGLSLVGLCVGAHSVQATTWTMPTPFGDSNLPTQIAYEFADEVQALTDDALNIVVRSNGKAVRHQLIPEAVISGRVVMGEFLLSILDAKHPVFKHDNIPLLANNYQDAKKLWEAAKPETEKQLDKMGLTYLYVVPWTPYSLYSTTPINEAFQFVGKPIRAYNQTTTNLIQALGATPTTVLLKDVETAFEKRQLAARFTSLSVGASTAIWNYAPYLNDLRVWIPKQVVVMNKKTFVGLDYLQQQAILNAADNAEKKGWQRVEERVASDISTLKANAMDYRLPSNTLLQSIQPIGQRMTQEWINESPKTIGPIYQTYRRLQAQSVQ